MRSNILSFASKIVIPVINFSFLSIEKNIIVRKGVDNLLHRIMGIKDDNFLQSVSLFKKVISLPSHPNLTNEDILKITNLIKKI